MTLQDSINRSRARDAARKATHAATRAKFDAMDTAPLFRANYGDGSFSPEYADIRDARCAKWGRAGIVQYRTSIEELNPRGEWFVCEPSRAQLNGPAIEGIR